MAPPATAESLMNVLLVVDLIWNQTMIAVFSECNRGVSRQTHLLAFVIDAHLFHALESSPWQI